MKNNIQNIEKKLRELDSLLSEKVTRMIRTYSYAKPISVSHQNDLISPNAD